MFFPKLTSINMRSLSLKGSHLLCDLSSQVHSPQLQQCCKYLLSLLLQQKVNYPLRVKAQWINVAADQQRDCSASSTLFRDTSTL